MIDELFAFVLEGIAGTLFRAAFSRRRAQRPRAVRDAMDAATAEELARLSTWARSRGLALRDDGVFTGTIEGMRVALDPGCDGSSPCGAELAVAVPNRAPAPVLLTEDERRGNVLGELFDDPTLHGALRSIAVSPEGARLRFAARRSTEVLDVALRLMRELPAAPPTHQARVGVYR